jgi:hypothetical protein
MTRPLPEVTQSVPPTAAIPMVPNVGSNALPRTAPVCASSCQTRSPGSRMYAPCAHRAPRAYTTVPMR